MKTITAKEFQRTSSQVPKAVAKVTTVQITYQGRPWTEIHPAAKLRKQTQAGSLAAFQESLDYTYAEVALPARPDYKKIRKQQLTDKK